MKTALKWITRIAIGLLSLAIIALLAGWLAMRASLPTLDGDLKLAGLSAPASVARDARGTVVLSAANDLDAVRALGFVHGQERFFEMDLARRSAAGELSELIGKATLAVDKDKRRHRMRARLSAFWDGLTDEDKRLITAYTEGVNAGLGTLGARPWQYLVLNTEPVAWRPVDSMLVSAEMSFMLQGRGVEDRLAEIGLRNQVGAALFAWLKPAGGEWDAALDGSRIDPAPLPGADQIDTRATPEKMVAQNLERAPQVGAFERESAPGSNNWAVGAKATRDGTAILADDMHLGIGVPAIWFRAQLEIGTGDARRRLSGVTLPGVPGLVVGSNGDIAWGFTNSYGQWFDVVAHPLSPADPRITTVNEEIRVKGSASEMLAVREAPWGPVLARDKAHEYSAWWFLYRQGGLNVASFRLAHARSVDEAVRIAQDAGIPHQNFMVADREGHIAWTIMGRIPARQGKPRPTSRGLSVAADDLPDGWLAPERYPLVKDPPNARLWTANSRQTGGANGTLIGDGGFDLGARAKQIRDRLDEKPQLDEKDLYAIQLDDEGRFLKRWVDLAKATAAAQGDAKSAALAKILGQWNGRADTDQTAYRVARGFRVQVMDKLWEAWLSAARRHAPATATELTSTERAPRLTHDGRFEYPVWQSLAARAPHLLPTPFKSWDAFLAAQLIEVHDELVRQSGSIENATWGERNRARFMHPFSRAMPFLSRFLDMPATPQAGDNHMPRVAAPGFGASQRLVVSPGHEDRAIFTMPGGQSGHPLSPYFGAGHRDWLDGVAAPLLAGPPAHTLTLSN